MGQNRIEAQWRCPTLEQPALDYFEVRMPWQSFAVRRETAERVLEALFGFERVEWVRLETVGGSVVWVRTEHVVYVREWSSAQRDSERRFWKEVDAEYEEKNSAGTEESGSEESETEASPEGTEVQETEGESSAGWVSEEGESSTPSLGLIMLVLWVVWLVAAMLEASP